VSKPVISSHYSNDDPRLYSYARRADPPWFPPRHFSPDAVVFVACIIAAIVGFVAAYLNP